MSLFHGQLVESVVDSSYSLYKSLKVVNHYSCFYSHEFFFDIGLKSSLIYGYKYFIVLISSSRVLLKLRGVLYY